jgi:hypothetical protein
MINPSEFRSASGLRNEIIGGKSWLKWIDPRCDFASLWLQSTWPLPAPQIITHLLLPRHPNQTMKTPSPAVSPIIPQMKSLHPKPVCKRLINLTLGIALSAGMTQAAVILSYHTNGTSAATIQSAAPVIQGTGITGANAVFVGNSETWREEGSFGNRVAGSLSGSNAAWRLWRAMGTGDPVATTSYEGFSFTYSGANPTLSLDTFAFDIIARDGNNPYTAKYALFASKNGGSFVQLGSGSQAITTGTQNTWYNFGLPVTFDISSFGTVTSGDSLEFRLAISGSDANEKGIFTQGIQLSATAVPEPSTAVLGALSMLFLLPRRRR